MNPRVYSSLKTLGRTRRRRRASSARRRSARPRPTGGVCWRSATPTCSPTSRSPRSTRRSAAAGLGRRGGRAGWSGASTNKVQPPVALSPSRATRPRTCACTEGCAWTPRSTSMRGILRGTTDTIQGQLRAPGAPRGHELTPRRRAGLCGEGNWSVYMQLLVRERSSAPRSQCDQGADTNLVAGTGFEPATSGL